MRLHESIAVAVKALAGPAQECEGLCLAGWMVAGECGSSELAAVYRAVGYGTTVDTTMRHTLGIGLGAFTERWRA
ncbi:hypothetical protein [Streptomyces sp. YIM S03343]